MDVQSLKGFCVAYEHPLIPGGWPEATRIYHASSQENDEFADSLPLLGVEESKIEKSYWDPRTRTWKRYTNRLKLSVLNRVVMNRLYRQGESS